jgi:mRNA-degrading endonuclease RelE of RelBE toxin-antitoxin system
MTWTVRVHEDAAKQLKAIPADHRKRILDDIIAFEEDPFRGLVKPLKGKENKGNSEKCRAVTASFSNQSMRCGS